MDQIESVEYNGFEISNGHVDHGWKKVVYPKRNRKQKPADQTATNGGKNAANGDNVFRSLEEQAEDRRRRILAAKMAVSDSDEDESRSKRRSNGYGFDDSEDEIAASMDREGDRPRLSPKHSGTIWTTYQLTPQWRVGGGVNFRSPQSPADVTAPAWEAPGFGTVDLMAEYAINQMFTLKGNITNVGDKLYGESLYRGHYVPGAGRLVQLSLIAKF